MVIVYSYASLPEAIQYQWMGKSSTKTVLQMGESLKRRELSCQELLEDKPFYGFFLGIS